MQHKLLTLLICSWLGAVQAAELGDVAPRSYIGQPLAVDIELLSLTPEELAGLQVRLADANVYRGANVAMNPALGSVRLQVERRGQKPVLHVTTTRAVEADYLHLYVQLGVPGKQDVRLATVWLQHDPNPAPPAQPALPPVSVMTSAQAEQIAAQARAGRLAAAKEAASKEAAGRDAAAKEAAAKDAAARAAAEEAARQAEAAAAPVRDRSKPAPLPSMHEAETGAPGEVRAAAAARRIAGVWVTADGKPTRAPTSADPAPVPVGVAQALLPLAPLPLPKGVKRPAPASCAPTGMSAKECLALDAHNAELSSKLTELEGKMKALQGALAGKAASPALATVSLQAPAPAAAASKVTTATALAPVAAAAAASTASTATVGSKAASAGSLPASSAPAVAASKASGAAAASLANVGGAASHADAATSASASLSARSEPEAHAAKAAAEEGAAASAGAAALAASAGAASAASAASTPPVATRQVRVLPKLKYKKEKPPEPEADYTLPLVAGGTGLLALLGAGLIWWRKKKSGKGPLKIWQGFRKKKAPEPEAEEFVEVKTATH